MREIIAVFFGTLAYPIGWIVSALLEGYDEGRRDGRRAARYAE